jgi:uncharacterized protein YbjT (DUF2867 family)
MNVLVTGGRGFIGRNCVEALKGEDHAVRALSHAEPAAEEIAHGDVRNPSSLAQALNDIDAVVHCVGIIIERRGITFESLVRDGTRNLVEACKQAGVKYIVFISALGTRPDAAARYHRTKWEAEEAIRTSGIAYTIFRPSVVYGRGDGFVSKFMRMPFVPLPGGGKSRFQPIFVKDLAVCVAESLKNPAAQNKTFDAGGPEKLTFKELMMTVLSVAKKKKHMISIPMPIMKVLAVIQNPFQKIYPRLALFTKDQYKLLQEDNVGDNSALIQAFPEVRLHSLREGLGTYLKG